MSDRRAPQSPHEARAEVFRLRQKLGALTDLLEPAVMDYADAQARWEAADDEAWTHIRTKFTPDTPKPVTKDWQVEVNKRTRPQRNEVDGAKRMVERIERQMKSLESQLNGAQSELRSLMAEHEQDRFRPSWEGERQPPRAPHPAEVAS